MLNNHVVTAASSQKVTDAFPIRATGVWFRPVRSYVPLIYILCVSFLVLLFCTRYRFLNHLSAFTLILFIFDSMAPDFLGTSSHISGECPWTQLYIYSNHIHIPQTSLLNIYNSVLLVTDIKMRRSCFLFKGMNSCSHLNDKHRILSMMLPQILLEMATNHF